MKIDMKKYLFIVLFSCFSFLLDAEEKKMVHLQYYADLNDALKEATRTHKPVFFNCYAGWSSASQLMDSVVLADPKLVEFIGENCVPLRIDMVKDLTGRELAEKYRVQYFAHFLILDSQGEVLHRIVGGAKAPEFLALLKRGLNPETSLKGMTQRYEQGDRELDFLADYAAVLDGADETDRFVEVSEYYLKHIDSSELYSPKSWEILYKRGMLYGSEWFDFIYEHRNELACCNGSQVTEYIVQCIFQEIFPYMIMESQDDQTLFLELKQKVEDLDSASWSRKQLLDICQILIFRQQKRYADMLTLWEQCMVDFPNPLVEWKFDMTLGLLHDMGVVEKERAAAFLTKKMQNLSGDKRLQYQHTISQLHSYQGIVFETGNFKEALEKARKTGKALFVDCYTSWCGPCQMMSKRVFPQKMVGDFCNPSFVCIKIDMEKGEGIELAKRWKVDSYPTYLILNGQGEVVYTFRGSVPAEEFVKRMGEGLSYWRKSVNK